MKTRSKSETPSLPRISNKIDYEHVLDSEYIRGTHCGDIVLAKRTSSTKDAEDRGIAGHSIFDEFKLYERNRRRLVLKEHKTLDLEKEIYEPEEVKHWRRKLDKPNNINNRLRQKSFHLEDNLWVEPHFKYNSEEKRSDCVLVFYEVFHKLGDIKIKYEQQLLDIQSEIICINVISPGKFILCTTEGNTYFYQKDDQQIYSFKTMIKNPDPDILDEKTFNSLDFYKRDLQNKLEMIYPVSANEVLWIIFIQKCSSAFNYCFHFKKIQFMYGENRAYIKETFEARKNIGSDAIRLKDGSFLFNSTLPLDYMCLLKTSNPMALYVIPKNKNEFLRSQLKSGELIFGTEFWSENNFWLVDLPHIKALREILNHTLVKHVLHHTQLCLSLVKIIIKLINSDIDCNAAISRFNYGFFYYKNIAKKPTNHKKGDCFNKVKNISKWMICTNPANQFIETESKKDINILEM